MPLSLSKIACVVFCLAVLLVEWGVGSDVTLKEQASFLFWIAAWAAVLTLTFKLPLDERLFKGDDFSFKSTVQSSIAQISLIIVCIPLAVKLASGEDGVTLNGWFRGGVLPGTVLARQPHFQIIGAMFKDFWGADDLAPTYVLHHFLTIAGCGMCLVLPVGFGASVVNGVQCECLSMCFNLMHNLPVVLSRSPGAIAVCKFFQWAFLIGMTLSHAIGVYIGAMFAFDLPIPPSAGDVWWTWWRIAYVVLCIAILTFRVVGHIIYGRKIISCTWMPELEAPGTLTQPITTSDMK